MLGDGTDEVTIVDSAFNSLAVALGAGNDSLSLTGVAAKRAVLAGGVGDADEYTDGGGNELRHLAISGFEIPTDVNTTPPVRGGKLGLGGLLARLLGRRSV